MSIRQLLAAILLQAVGDWRALQAGIPRKGARHVAINCGYGSDCHREMLGFFHSDWCEGICLELGIDYGAMLNRLGVTQ